MDMMMMMMMINLLKSNSEEVFDFLLGEMTSEKVRTMKQNLNQEFILIYQLCECVCLRIRKMSL